MNYSETLEFLSRRGNEVQGVHLGLHRTFAIMHALGNPHERLTVLHIAGTNGKGSVAAMAESILRQAGWTTGLYTSPHLVRIEERFRISGREISPRSFAAISSRIAETETGLLQKKLLDRPLTLFELLTACAFVHFAERKVDVAVIEVGLGGKLDATNVVRPQVSVITGISLDHQNFLGNTLAEIAGEKAGIIKPGVPAISGCYKGIPRRIIHGRAREVGAPLLEIWRDFTVRIVGQRQGHYTIDLQTPGRLYRRLRLSLAGEHQTRNAALAVTAVEALKSLPVRVADVRRALASTRWPGRLDEYRSFRRTLLDGAHNPEGARLLREFLEEQHESEVHLVFGVLRDKDIYKMSAHLFPVATSIHLAAPANSRSADPTEVAGLHRRFRGRIHVHRSSREALLAAWERCSRTGLVVVTGSLYLLGELLPFVRENVR